jgi:hypothetical protein
LIEESIAILHEYWSKITNLPRILVLLHSMSKAFARIDLTNTVNAKHAKQTIDYFNGVIPHYEHIEDIPDTIDDMTNNELSLIPDKTKSRILTGEYDRLMDGTK